MNTYEKIKDRVNQPDNDKWRKIGEIAIKAAQPFGILAIIIFVPDNFREASIAAWIGLCNAIKAGTKLTTK